MRTRKGRAGGLWIPGSFDMRHRAGRTLVFGFPPSGGLAAVNVSLPPAVLYPNEPAGYTAFAEHNFSTPITQTAPTATGILGLWSIDDPALLPNMTNVQDLSAPQSPALVFQGKFPSALVGGQTSIKWEGWDSASGAQNYGTEMLELYLSLWLKILGADFEASTTADTRIAYLGYAEPKTGPANEGGPKLKLDTPQIRGDFNLRFQQLGNVSRTLDQNINTNRLMTCGIWHQWEILCKLNTLGVANGVLRWWLDRTLIMDYSDVTYITAGNTLGFYAFKFWPYWGGTGETKTRDDFIQVDHLYMSGKVVPVPPPPPPPPPPPGGFYPHQPTGYTAFLSYNGNCIVGIGTPCGELGAWLWSNGYAADAANIASVSVADAPTNALDPLLNVLQTTFPTGQAPGFAPVHLGGWNALFTNQQHQGEIYLSMWVQIVGPDYEAYPGVNKFGFFGYGTGTGIDISNDGFFDLRPPVQGGPNGVIVTQMTLEFQQQNNVTRQINTGVSMSVGPWHRWELVLKLNTLGSANGVLQWWHDGVQIANLSDMVFVTPGNTNGFYSYSWQPYWGGGSGGQNPKTRTDFVRTDQLYISGKAILPGFYVSPTGSPTGNGSWINPWDLQTALSGAGGVIAPGNTIWLRGGNYSGIASYQPSVAGTPLNRIIFRAYPGEQPVLLGQLEILGTKGAAYLRFQGLDVANPTIETNQGLNGVRVIDCTGIQLIHLSSHNWGGAGFAPQGAGLGDFLMYGCLSYQNGYVGANDARSYGVYAQAGNTGPYEAEANLFFDNFGWGVHNFGESTLLKNWHWRKNCSFSGGDVNFKAPEGEYIMQQISMSGMIFDDNLSWNAGSKFRVAANIGDPVPPDGTDISFQRNYLMGQLQFQLWELPTMLDNTFVNCGEIDHVAPNNGTLPAFPTYNVNRNTYHLNPTFAVKENNVFQSLTFTQWQVRGYDAQGTTVAVNPTATRVFAVPSTWEPGRANIVIYNWANVASVAVDLSSVLNVGDVFEVRYAQQYFGAKLLDNQTYGGGTVSFNMTPLTLNPPPVDSGFIARAGGAPKTPPTSQQFGCFIVRKVGS